MKSIIYFSAVSISLLLGSCAGGSSTSNQTNNTDAKKSQTTTGGQTFAFDTTQLKKGEAFYQCEMNPEVLSDKAGICPKCGMDLEKVVKK